VDVPDDDAKPASAAAPVHSAADDPEVARVAAALLAADPQGHRLAAVLRRSIDMLLDGQHTQRYRWDQLHKTEKTHAGTLIEINLQREFGFADGERMDYRIADVDVDCKFSQTLNGWMVPLEAHDEVLLLVWAVDQESRWCAGLVRGRPNLLNEGRNRDRKATLNAAGRAAIHWLHQDQPLAKNALLYLPKEDLDAIFGQKSGNKRIDELFRRAQAVPISRSVVATVAAQEDYMRRLRANGGARTALRPEGIVILGQYGVHQAVARGLHLPVPGPGESVSIRLARLQPHHGQALAVELDGVQWTRALPQDPAETAPELPRTNERNHTE
jgi:hypothetical protein